jgi:hypothetical protein
MTNWQNENALCPNTIGNTMVFEKDFPNVRSPYFSNNAPLIGIIFKSFHFLEHPLHPLAGSLGIVLGNIFSMLSNSFHGQ